MVGILEKRLQELGFCKWFPNSIRPDNGLNLEIQLREEIQDTLDRLSDL